jgi:hypothetical protein
MSEKCADTPRQGARRPFNVRTRLVGSLGASSRAAHSRFHTATILVLVAFDGFTRNRRNVWISKFRSASFCSAR